MSSNDGSRRCSATTRAGEPCKAWATHGSHLCAAHAGKTGAPKGNQNRVTHGLYAAPPKKLETIDDAVDNLGEQLARSSEFLAATDDPEVWGRVFSLHAQALSRFGRLLRDQRMLGGETADDLLGAVSKLLDVINSEKDFEVTL